MYIYHETWYLLCIKQRLTLTIEKNEKKKKKQQQKENVLKA